MKKLIFVLLFCLLCSSAFASDVWKFRVDEVTTPSLTNIRVSFTVLLNDKDYVRDDIIFDPSELDGLTNSQKLTAIGSRVKAKCAVYIKNYSAANGLKALVQGNVYAAQ